MIEVEKFLARADAYAVSAGLTRSTVSLYIFNDSKKLDLLANGAGDIGMRTLAQRTKRLGEMETALRNKQRAAR